MCSETMMSTLQNRDNSCLAENKKNQNTKKRKMVVNGIQTLFKRHNITTAYRQRAFRLYLSLGSHLWVLQELSSQIKPLERFIYVFIYVCVYIFLYKTHAPVKKIIRISLLTSKAFKCTVVMQLYIFSWLEDLGSLSLNKLMKAVWDYSITPGSSIKLQTLLWLQFCSACAAVFLFLPWTGSPRHSDAGLKMDHAAPGARLVYRPEEPGGWEVTGHLEGRELKSHVVWVVTCSRDLGGNPESWGPFLTVEERWVSIGGGEEPGDSIVIYF